MIQHNIWKIQWLQKKTHRFILVKIREHTCAHEAKSCTRTHQSMQTCIYAYISATEDRIFMKFETKAHNRVINHHKNFGKDPCT